MAKKIYSEALEDYYKIEQNKALQHQVDTVKRL